VKTDLTQAQQCLLEGMWLAGPTKLHHVHDLGSKLPVMQNLVAKGLAEHGKVYHSGLWKGRLTKAGVALARLRLFGA
jgi:hypothetical protein